MRSERSTSYITAALLSAALGLCGGDPAAAVMAAGPRSPAQSAGVEPRRAMITELPADGPNSAIASQARLFDHLVGAWDCEFVVYSEDGKVRRSTGELLFGWVLDGWALQDIWISYPEKGSGSTRDIGTSLRFYDAKADLWRVVFIAASESYIVQVDGRAEGDRIVLLGKGANGEPSRRWSFNDILPNSFVWRGEKSRDGGKTWWLQEEHHMRRRVATKP